MNGMAAQDNYDFSEIMVVERIFRMSSLLHIFDVNGNLVARNIS
ncbi:hypothetical protein SDC9_209157 [bioreactor metagenome]|uniref:Uncharacterized protein n=1 Tax=bioreactor metagenome TaxID=1076179 RepID=A0A645JEA6_9ZZZZ